MPIEISPTLSAELIKDDYLRRLLVDLINNVRVIAASAASDSSLADATAVVDGGTPIAPTATPVQTSAVSVGAAVPTLPAVAPEIVELQSVVTQHAADLVILQNGLNGLIADVRTLQSTYNALIETLRSGGTVQ